MYSVISTKGSLKLKESVPVVLDSSCHTFYPASDFLMYQLFEEGKENNSVKQNASRIVRWLNFITRGKKNECEELIFSATNRDIEQFRNELLGSLKPEAVNTYLKVVCDFYFYCQSDTNIPYNYLIGWRDMLKEVCVPLIEVGKPKNESFEYAYAPSQNYSMPFKVKPLVNSRLPIPTPIEFEELLDEIVERRSKNSKESQKEFLIERDLLMCKWMGHVGLRRREVAALKLEDLAFENIDTDAMVELEIKRGTKYGKARPVLVEPQLIRDTLLYIKVERDDIINEFHSTHKDTGEVFISCSHRSKDIRLNPGTISDLIADLELGLSPHSLRRYALTRFATILLAIEDKKVRKGEQQKVKDKEVLFHLKEQAGHESIDTTLRRYVDIAKARYLSKEDIHNLKEYRDGLIAMASYQIDNAESKSYI